MKRACFIPIKVNSTRVKGKNFKLLGGKPLYKWVFDAIIEANCFDDVFVDTNVFHYDTDCKDSLLKDITDYGFTHITRGEGLDRDDANGNDLMVNWLTRYGDTYDYYFQMFVTGPFISPETIVKAACNVTTYKSVFTATQHLGWYWFNNQPLNYRPDILPRSQDAEMVCSETTALYGISREELEKYHCRIGKTPKMIMVDEIEAIDIDTQMDFKFAEFVIKENLYGKDTDNDISV